MATAKTRTELVALIGAWLDDNADATVATLTLTITRGDVQIVHQDTRNYELVAPPAPESGAGG